MIKRSKVRYLDSVIMFAEENGFVENKAFMYKKSLDINNEKTVRINFETTYLTIAFKSRNLSIYFETYYCPFNKRGVHLEQIKEVINICDLYDIFNLLSDYCESKNRVDNIYFEHFHDSVYRDTYYLTNVSAFFVIKDSNAHLFFTNVKDSNLIDDVFGHIT